MPVGVFLVIKALLGNGAALKESHWFRCKEKCQTEQDVEYDVDAVHIIHFSRSCDNVL